MNSNSNPETRFSLIARICDPSDDDAWTEFVQIYQPVVHRFIQRSGLQYADAAEITQEVLSRVAATVDSWDGDRSDASFRGWLYRITRNLTIDFLRKEKSQKKRIAVDQGGVSQLAGPDESDVFQAEFEKQLFQWAADKLRPSFKPTNWKAFWMSTVEGVPVDEVAEMLQIEHGAVYVARSRIMSRLSSMVQNRLNETTP